ncbi:MAG TPA: hypothetical protein VE153_15310 [Myxococcus sp.]|nr:hypothetical protein [Myxococcus sp.]
MTDTVHLLALLGEPGARAQLGASAPAVLPSPSSQTAVRLRWKRTFQHLGKPVSVGALVALGHRLLPAYERDPYVPPLNVAQYITSPAEGAQQLRAALEVIGAWAGRPNRTNGKRLRELVVDWRWLRFHHGHDAQCAVSCVEHTQLAAMAARKFEQEAIQALLRSSELVEPHSPTREDTDRILREALQASLHGNRAHTR